MCGPPFWPGALRGEDVTATRLKIWDGVGQIGGTKITVESGGYRLLFDWGLVYEPSGTFWSDAVQPRPDGAGLRAMLMTGDLPRLDGIYPADWAAEAGLAPPDGQTLLWISHLHKDHMAALPWLDPAVPTYLHPESMQMLRALVETGVEPVLPAGARPLVPGEVIEHGPLRFRSLNIDHDIPGACGLLIETPDGAVVYTGDLRYHGVHTDWVEQFITAAHALKPKILLIEGTRFFPPDEREETPRARRATSDPPPRQRGEADVPGRVAEIIQDHRDLAMITLYPRNTERLSGIVQAVTGTGRLPLLRPATAALWAAMGGDLGQVGLYLRPEEERQLDQDAAPAWLQQTAVSAASLWNTERVRSNQREVLLQMELATLPDLVDLSPGADSVFIHSNGEPLGPFDPNWAVLQRWLERLGIPLRWAGCSGHASPEDLVRIVQEIAPEFFMPIHSKHPELFLVPEVKRILPVQGSAYSIKTGRQIGE